MLKTTVQMITALTSVLSFTTHSGAGSSAASTMRSADLQNNVISLGCIIQALILKLTVMLYTLYRCKYLSEEVCVYFFYLYEIHSVFLLYRWLWWSDMEDLCTTVIRSHWSLVQRFISAADVIVSAQPFSALFLFGYTCIANCCSYCFSSDV